MPWWQTPSQGGFHCLTLAHALMARAGLPVTLLSGIGGKLGDVLISNPGGARVRRRPIQRTGRRHFLADRRRRHFLEQEGLNAWGIWDFTEWELLAQHLRKGSSTPSSGALRTRGMSSNDACCPRSSMPHLPVVEGLRFGHPLAVERPEDPSRSWTSGR